ncbi:MAG: hypothetical protein J6Y11_10640 [Paludibacteraceae bacterium]|nr:hypothetical protein [Paludibacteraceae bacterium]
MSIFKLKCPECGAFLQINETGEIAPGNRTREEAICPVCQHEVYSSMTSGFVEVYEISEDEYNNKHNC